MPARGLPADLSPEAVEQVALEGGDAPSWMMGDEILGYDWDARIERRMWGFRSQVGPVPDGQGAHALPEGGHRFHAFARDRHAAGYSRVKEGEPWAVFSSYVHNETPHTAAPPQGHPDWIVPVHQETSVREFVGCVDEFLDGVREMGDPASMRFTYIFDF